MEPAMIKPAYHTESTVADDGTLHLHGLPFPPGEAVEVILIPRTRGALAEEGASLRGTVLRYENPTAPVAEQDWDLAG
jgi:hypothetical protein